MSSGHSQPQLLYAVNNIRAFHVQNGQEHEITTSGPQEMQLLMVPTQDAFADLSSADPSSAAPEEDFYLHLYLPPELDQALPATTQIYHQPPSSYLIPRWDLGPDSGAFIKIVFPNIGHGPGKVTQEDVDTFETILAQCTAFLERSGPQHAKYDPSTYKPGQGYVSSGPDKHTGRGQIVLVDEENGSVVGELSQGYSLAEDPNVQAGSKRPVEIELPQNGSTSNAIKISNVSEEYLAMSRHPAYAKSTIVQTSAKASRLIVTGSTALANAMASGANSFQQKTQPNAKAMTFSPATHERIRQIHNLTTSAVGLSAKTIGSLSRYAQNAGARVAGRGDKVKDKKGFRDGQPDEAYKPGIMNKSMIAFSTIADGIDTAGRHLLTSGSAAATSVVGHKYGSEAGQVTAKLGGGVKNVGLVYIDAAGVSRRALIKSVAKGMVVGRMPDGQQVLVGTGDGGVIPQEALPQQLEQQDQYRPQNLNQPGMQTEGYGMHGGSQVPPAYGVHGGQYSNVGEPLAAQGYPREKR